MCTSLQTECCRQDATFGIVVARNQIRHGKEGLYTDDMKKQVIERSVNRTMLEYAKDEKALKMTMA